ncbi:hypothetical protein WKI65_42940 [Streptomyces sp. MS1.AVA.3]|uniref:hypothetical protein n=1 Tax=Streptomyces decoyicus TaxID=249567 RepID=UPI0030C5E191
MTTETSTTTQITDSAEHAITRADKQRKQLAESMTADSFHLDTYSLQPVLRAQANALPWRHVRARINTGLTPIEALRDVRAEQTRRLLGTSESQSTDALVNETERMEREAARNFLRDTERLAA